MIKDLISEVNDQLARGHRKIVLPGPTLTASDGQLIVEAFTGTGWQVDADYGIGMSLHMRFEPEAL
jgi:hypothetical protein